MKRRPVTEERKNRKDWSMRSQSYTVEAHRISWLYVLVCAVSHINELKWWWWWWWYQ